MNASRFDRISKLFANGRVERQEPPATPEPVDGAGLEAGGFDPAQKTFYLFVQAFRSGSIAPKAGADGVYTVTLEQGLGQTAYFADRPSRDAGAIPTPEFLDGLGFSPANPPNAALVLETAPGETEIAVVELTNPTYEVTTHTATYDVTVLENWRATGEYGLEEVSDDLASLAPRFGSAHLLIDDCRADRVGCQFPSGSGGAYYPPYDDLPFCYAPGTRQCLPCESYPADRFADAADAARAYWSVLCNQRFPECENTCSAFFTWPDSVYEYESGA